MHSVSSHSHSPQPTWNHVPPSPTSCGHDRKWYSTRIPGRHGETCTNGDDPRGALYDSADECCRNRESWRSGRDRCRVVDVCDETDAPTMRPTRYPTHDPTNHPTPRPSKKVRNV